MICAIHQPNFFPWMGYFNKIARADVFVFLNLVDYEKSGHSMQGYGNRVAIYGNDNRIMCPLVREHGHQVINTVKIKNIQWKNELLQKLKLTYCDRQHYSDVMLFVNRILSYETEYLSEFNINAIREICNILNINVEFYRQDKLNVNGSSSELLINIIKKCNCTDYIYGKGGSKYQNEDLFKDNNIELIAQNYIQPQYYQSNDVFVPGLSILDALFCCGFEKTEELVKS